MVGMATSDTGLTRPTPYSAISGSPVPAIAASSSRRPGGRWRRPSASPSAGGWRRRSHRAVGIATAQQPARHGGGAVDVGVDGAQRQHDRRDRPGRRAGRPMARRSRSASGAIDPPPLPSTAIVTTARPR